MIRVTTARRAAIALIFAFVIAAFAIVPQMRGTIVRAISGGDKDIVYFNNLVQEDSDPNNNYCFGPNRKAAADKAVKDGKVESVEAYIAKTDGTGDFFESIEVDPALCAAIAVHMDESLRLDEKILKDEQDELIGQRADKAHLHFLRSQEYWDKAVELIKKNLETSEIKIEKLSTYTSAMYMWNAKLEGDKPSVIRRDTTLAGGTMVIFDLGEKGIIKLRLECGYQPVNIYYWPAPKDAPEVPDNPTEPTTQPSTTEPTTQPTTEPTTRPETTTLQPKNPTAGPQGQDPTNPDFGGGPNHDNVTELTPEPTSPTKYTPPTPPTTEPSTTKKQTPTPSTTQPSTTSSGSKIVDDSQGKTETRVAKDPDTGKTTTKTYEVVAGDGTTRQNLDEVQESHHSSSTVEEPLCTDAVNQGDLDPADVE